jgi:hypothetical protein
MPVNTFPKQLIKVIALYFFGSFELPFFLKIGVITPTDQLTGTTPLSNNKVKQFLFCTLIDFSRALDTIWE